VLHSCPTPHAGFAPSESAISRQRTAHDRGLATIVCAARAGDHAAWASLVRRFDRGLRIIARSYRLAPADVDDIVQASWLNLLEEIEGLREPAAVGGWLATTTRRNAMRLLQRRTREQLTADPDLGDRPDSIGPEVGLLATEQSEVLIGAMAVLPERHRRLIMVLIDQPTLDYRQVGELLSMPVGSIGPTRARSLARLSRDPQLRKIREPSS
jgi:RNA polymerase sigma factor (sigma-70 family)